MPRRAKRLVIWVILVATLAGCATAPQVQPSTNAATREGSANQASDRAAPVYVLPNCKMHSGIRHCQWIEPRGYMPNSETQPEEESTPGIEI
jgi:ABC-type uncharacterized transport system auxiliary subunit